MTPVLGLPLLRDTFFNIARDLYISAMTILKLERGISSLQRRDAAKGSRLRGSMDSRVGRECADRTYPVDDAVATRCAHLLIPDHRDEADASIAGTALTSAIRVFRSHPSRRLSSSLCSPIRLSARFHGGKLATEVFSWFGSHALLGANESVGRAAMWLDVSADRKKTHKAWPSFAAVVISTTSYSGDPNVQCRKDKRIDDTAAGESGSSRR
jgi:hypothetical protein